MANKEEWNNRYAEPECIYGLEPNVFLREQLSLLHPGYLLLPGEGEGRNALWAARNGWRVLAFDFSYSALNKALKLLGREGVDVMYSLNSAETFRPYWKFDAIGLIYFHLAREVRIDFHRKIAGWLNPGGTLIMECFHPEQIGRDSGGPKNPDMLPSHNDLINDFINLKIDTLNKEEILLNEGLLHQGKAVVTRLIARKPD